MHHYNNFNGFLLEEEDKILDARNRGFRYGDAIFETIRVANQKLLHWDYHYERLSEALEFLKLDIEGIDKAFWEKELEKVYVRNNIANSRLRLTVFRDSQGLYAPKRNKCGFLIEGKELEQEKYYLNEEGLKLGLFTEVKRSCQPFSNIKTTNSLPYVLAGLYSGKNDFDESIILNDQGNVSEAVSSNVFVVKGDQIYTPSLDQGCISGVMRKVIVKKFGALYNVNEGNVSLEDLKTSDEIFITNVIKGVQWVKEFEGKSYGNSTATKVLQSINTLVN